MGKARALLTSVVLAVSLGVASPAFASFGAIAYDQSTGGFGISWDQPTQSHANELALRDCKSDKCRVMPIPPGQCGALANTNNREESNAWAAEMRPSKTAAELAAVERCQKNTAGQCKIRGSECNH